MTILLTSATIIFLILLALLYHQLGNIAIELKYNNTLKEEQNKILNRLANRF